MNKMTIICLSLLLNGCVAPIIGDLKQKPNTICFDITDDPIFKKSYYNKYAIVLEGAQYDENRIKIDDQYTRGDVGQLSRLLLYKGYDVYRLEFSRTNLGVLERLVDRIASVSDNNTKLFFAYSGKGGKSGLWTKAILVGTQAIIPANATISPKYLFNLLTSIRGKRAVLINACESGIFATEAITTKFKGIIITSCPKGTLTTPHETTNTTAIFAAFLTLYADDPSIKFNLATIPLDSAGSFWVNLTHHLNNIFSSKPISYDTVIYVNSNYWF